MPKKSIKPYWIEYRWKSLPDLLFTQRYKTKKAAKEGLKALIRKNLYIIEDSNLT